MTKLQFNDTDLYVFVDYYPDGKVLLKLVEEETDEPYCTASVNIPNITMYDKEVIIKNYGENVGVYEALIKANVIKPAHRYTSSEYVKKIPICKLLIEKDQIIQPNKNFDNETCILNKPYTSC